jgi:hypothetical protein
MAFVDRLKPMNREELIKFDEYVEQHSIGETPMILTSFEERGMKKGIQKGKTEGIFKKRKAVILKMVSKKYKIQEISEITGEPVEKIKEMIKNG